MLSKPKRRRSSRHKQTTRILKRGIGTTQARLPQKKLRIFLRNPCQIPVIVISFRHQWCPKRWKVATTLPVILLNRVTRAQRRARTFVSNPATYQTRDPRHRKRAMSTIEIANTTAENASKQLHLHSASFSLRL